MATEHAELLASLAVRQPVPHNVKAVFRKERLILPRGRNKEETVQKPAQEQVLPESLGNIPSVVPDVATIPFNLRKKRKVLHEEDLTQKDHKIMPTKERSGKLEMRRPVRPIDRQKMRPWLKNLLDTGSVFGLNWMKREEGVFQISWRHASRLGWSLETDGDVFERWARHTGIFKDGDDPEPKRWKANFRCALHSLPDVKELTSPTDRKGRNASRTYRFLNPSEVQPPVKRKHRYTIQIPYTYERSSDDNTSQNAESDTPHSEEDVGESVRQVPHCDHDYAARQDEEAQTTSTTFQCHGSGYVLIKSKGAHEYEFRLTSSSGESSSSSGSQDMDSKKQSGLRKSPSSQRKPQVSKKKSLVGKTITQPLRKGKGNSKFTKSKSLQNAGNKIKKTIEENGEGQKRTKPSKVSLKELLSSRQGVGLDGGGKKSRPKRSANTAAKKPKKEKEDIEASGNSKPKDEENMDAPSQRHSLQACMLLLEAATQLDRMDSLTTSTSTAVALPTTTTSAVPANRLPTMSASVNSVQLTEAPVKGLHHFLGLSTAPPSLTSTPAMASLMTAASHASSTVPAIASVVLLDPSGGNESGKSPVSKGDGVSSNKVHDGVGLNHNSGEAVSAAASSPAGVGLSMLKQLLRLTCPPSATAVTRSVPSVMTSFAQASTAQTICNASLPGSKAVENKREGQIVSSVLEKSGKSALPAGRSPSPSFEVVAEYEVGSSPAETWEEADEKNFPYLRVHTSKVYVKAEPQILDATKSKTQSSLSAAVVGVEESHQMSMSSLAVEQPAVSAALCTHMTQAGIMAAASPASNISQTPVSAADLGPAAQVTLPPSLACSLPQTFSVMLPKAADSSTLPVAVTDSFQLRAAQKEASTLTSLPSATLGISQLLALCAANGSSQVIFKPEVSVDGCDDTVNSAYTSPQNGVDSQVHDVPTATVQKPLLTIHKAPEAVQQESVTSQEENQILKCACDLKGVASNSHTDISDRHTSEQNVRTWDNVPGGYTSLDTNGMEVETDSSRGVLLQGTIDTHVSKTTK